MAKLASLLHNSVYIYVFVLLSNKMIYQLKCLGIKQEKTIKKFKFVFKSFNLLIRFEAQNSSYPLTRKLLKENLRSPLRNGNFCNRRIQRFCVHLMYWNEIYVNGNILLEHGWQGWPEKVSDVFLFQFFSLGPTLKIEICYWSLYFLKNVCFSHSWREQWLLLVW